MTMGGSKSIYFDSSKTDYARGVPRCEANASSMEDDLGLTFL